MAEAMRAGAKFPPIKVIFDGTTYWLIDGFHRVEAAHEAGLTEIAAEITPGTLEDAQWLCLAANQTHGLRRTNEDKRRAVMAALQHPRSAGMSSNAIAKHVGVSHTLVDDCRRELAPTLADSASATKRQCSDGRVMNTENIGGNSSSPKTPKPAKLRLVAANGSSLRPSEAIDPQEHWAKLSDAIATLADHKLSAKDFVALTPVEQIQALYAKARAACDFIYLVFEGFGKEEKAK